MTEDAFGTVVGRYERMAEELEKAMEEEQKKQEAECSVSFSGCLPCWPWCTHLWRVRSLWSRTGYGEAVGGISDPAIAFTYGFLLPGEAYDNVFANPTLLDSIYVVL